MAARSSGLTRQAGEAAGALVARLPWGARGARQPVRAVLAVRAGAAALAGHPRLAVLARQAVVAVEARGARLALSAIHARRAWRAWRITAILARPPRRARWRGLGRLQPKLLNLHVALNAKRVQALTNALQLRAALATPGESTVANSQVPGDGRG